MIGEICPVFSFVAFLLCVSVPPWLATHIPKLSPEEPDHVDLMCDFKKIVPRKRFCDNIKGVKSISEVRRL